MTPQPIPPNRLGVPTIPRLVSDMARGLEHLGFYGFAHNDIKAENVLLFRDAQGDLVAKITDLGCALGVCGFDST